MRKLKTLLALLVLSFFTIGNVWAKTTVPAQNYEFTQSSTPTGWSVGSSNTQDANYLKLSSGDYVEMTTASIFTPGEVLSSSTMDVEVSCGTFGSWSGDKSVKVTVELRKSDGTVLTTANSTFSSLTNKENAYKSAISVSKPANPAQIAYLRVTFSDFTTGPTLRMKNVRLTYETDEVSTTPTLTCATTELTFEAEANSTDQKQFTFSGSNLTADAGLAIAGTNASLFSVQPTSVDKGTGTITNSQVTVTYSPTAAGEHSATLTISSTGATSKTITLSGTATTPAVKHKAFFYNGETLLNTGGTEFAEGAAVSYSGETPESCETGTGKSSTFVGWADATWTGKKTAKGDITANFYEGALPAMETSDVTYYAVFAKVVPGTTTWDLTTIGNLTSTDVFVFADASNYALNNNGGTTSAPKANVITVNAQNQITSTVTDTLKWNISGNATDGYSFSPNGSTTTWLYCNTNASSSSNNNMRVGNGGDYNRIVFKLDANGYLVTKDTYTARYLSRYNTQDFRGYTSDGTNPVAPKFYKATTTPGAASNYLTMCEAPTQCETPEFEPVAGTYNVAKEVTISCGTAGASIYYTIDGTTPSDASTLYSSAITVDTTTTIKAIAIKDGLTDSEVASATYTLQCKTPTITKAEAHFLEEATITLACETEGAEIRYTLDGNDPDGGSTLYSAPFKINATKTIKAIALKTNWTNSVIADETFTKATILTVAQANDTLGKTSPIANQYVNGVISQVDSYNSTYKSITYWISDDGTTTGQLQVYSGKGVAGADFSKKEDLQVGDEVLIFGNLKVHNSTIKEFDASSQIVTFNRPAPVPVLTAAPASIDFGSVKQDAVVADKTVTVTFSDLTDDVTYSGLSAPFTASGTIAKTGDVITISASTATPGTYNQTLTITSEADNKSVEINVTLTVTAPLPMADYKKTALASIKSSDIVLITMKKGDDIYALKENGTSNPIAVSVTESGDTITTNEEDIYWNIVNSKDSLTIYPNGTTAKWLYCINDNQGARVGTGGTGNDKIWVVDGTYLKNAGKTRWLGVYTNSSDWRTYNNTTGNIAGQTLAFYVKLNGGTTGFDNIESDVKAVKVLRDGQIYILRGEKVYTIQGQLVK